MSLEDGIKKIQDEIFQLEMKDLWDFYDHVHYRELKKRLKTLKEEQEHEGKTV